MKTISVTDLAKMPAPTLIDVREDFEYTSAHAPGATNIPLHQLSTRLDDLRQLSRVFVICQSGGRSAQATIALASAGVDATNVEGGTTAWVSAGLPVETL